MLSMWQYWCIIHKSAQYQVQSVQEVSSAEEYASTRIGVQELHTTENTALEALAGRLTLV